jgi:fatty-acyl-CoA synthase
MYDVKLSNAVFSAQHDLPIIEKTVADVLREAAASAPDAPALTEISTSGEAKRRWTYSELLADVRTAGGCALHKIRPPRADRDLGSKRSRMGPA